jgi:uncharacterized repeat protein (TIGR03809 family)
MIEVIRGGITLMQQARASALPPDQVALRWRDLAERRRSHFVELYESGRWKHYYSEADFVQRMREVVAAAEEWEKLVSRQTAKRPS